jgi:hypothetical protein
MCSPRILRIAARAEMAELADALRSGRSGGSLVWVQIPLSAPLKDIDKPHLAKFAQVRFF